MLAGRLVAHAVRLHDQPVHEREHFVVGRVAVQIGLVPEADRAVTVADLDRHEREAELQIRARGVAIRDAVAIGVEVGPRIQVRPPLSRGHGHRAVAVDRHARDQAVEHDVVPLVEYRQLEDAVRQSGHAEVAVRIALLEGDVLRVGQAQRHVARRELEGVVAAGVVGALIRRAAHVVAVHVTGDRRVADQAAALGQRVTKTRHGRIVAAIVDDLGVRKAVLHVEAARAELLEIGRLARTHERLVRLAAVERVRLQPFLAARDAIGRRHGLDLVEARVEVDDQRLACERRHRLAVFLVGRAGHDHADRLVGVSRDRARVLASRRVDGAGQRVRQRHVEHVVGRLAGVITEPAGLVEQHDLEAAQTCFLGSEDVDAAAGIVLTVQRVVVLVHQHRDLRGGQRRLGQHHRDCRRDLGAGRRELRRDLGTAHVVAALAATGDEVARGRAVQRRIKRADLARDGVGHRATRRLQRRVDAVRRHHGDEVMLVRVEVDVLRVERRAPGGGRVRTAPAVADVADRGDTEHRLPGLA